MSLSPYQQELLAVFRRIARRGRPLALENDDIEYVGLFQHLLDELQRFNEEKVNG